MPLEQSMHLTRAYPSDMQAKLDATAPGQADYADLTSEHHCDACAAWDPSSKSRQKRRCILHTQMMRKPGPTVAADQRACVRFVMNPKKLPPPPKSELELRRERFFDLDSWRRSQRHPGNLTRSILNTDATVFVFQRHLGRWSWGVSYEAGRRSVFSTRLFPDRATAIADVWQQQVATMTPSQSVSAASPEQDGDIPLIFDR
jgi:hypothetical protein